MTAGPLLLVSARARRNPRGACCSARCSRSRRSASRTALATRARVAATIWSRKASMGILIIREVAEGVVKTGAESPGARQDQNPHVSQRKRDVGHPVGAYVY